MGKWKYDFAIEGKNLRKAIQLADTTEKKMDYLKIFSDIDILLSEAERIETDSKALELIVGFKEELKKGKDSLIYIDESDIFKRELNVCLKNLYDLFDKLEFWIGL
jgi:hypothetical protein